jgi:hypothetical protein
MLDGKILCDRGQWKIKKQGSHFNDIATNIECPNRLKKPYSGNVQPFQASNVLKGRNFLITWY